MISYDNISHKFSAAAEADGCFGCWITPSGKTSDNSKLFADYDHSKVVGG
ncbi:MAG: hypothetical protein OXC48_03505 [Endozoicomonadaceae bacterium]|nr:hypothetical protein [Endozoicomonadaceae bacterium]